MSVTGYTSTTSVAPGGRVEFRLSADPAGSVELRVERYGAGIVWSDTVSVATHPTPPPTTLSHAWPVARALTVTTDWATGLYVLKARRTGASAYEELAEFVVRPSSPGFAARLLLVVDFVTPQAYNSVGGRNFYNLRQPKVSFNRPTAPDPGNGARRLVAWLNAGSFAHDCASLVDLHTNPGLLADYDCIIFGSHVEYWSREMRDQTEKFIRNGGNVISLSGNTCYRQVRFESATRTLVGYKNAAADPAPERSTVTVAFAQPPVNRPPNAMLGVGWTYGAWGGPVTAYSLHFPTHWAMTGVPSTVRTTYPFMSYETDATGFVIEDEGHPRVTGEEGTPLATVVLASADLGHWTGKAGMATATLFVRGGVVFAAGTTEWTNMLGDPTIGRITQNIVERLRTRREFAWEDVGHANHVVALTALEGKLYGATSVNRLWQRHPVLADAQWRQIGHANGVTSLAADRGLLFAITVDNGLHWRKPVDRDVVWTRIGTGPGSGTRALAALGGTLYAVAHDGLVYHRSASNVTAPWIATGGLPATTAINAMCSYNGILFASTSTNRLLRMSFDFPKESLRWIDIGSSRAARGLAVVENMLFAVTPDHRLSWLDLHHPALDGLSRES